MKYTSNTYLTIQFSLVEVRFLFLFMSAYLHIELYYVAAFRDYKFVGENNAPTTLENIQEANSYQMYNIPAY